MTRPIARGARWPVLTIARGARGPLLTIAFLASAAVYGLVLWLAPRYALATPVAERPLLTVLGLYVVASGLYFAALTVALRRPASRGLGWFVLGTSAAFRAILLPTPPYQEIDIYRYLWDGAVTAAGEDPYEYAPQRVVDGLGKATTVRTDGRLAALVSLADSDPALAETLRTVHYAALPSPYPPVSQAVFAAAAATTPTGSSAFTRLVWLKAWLVAFDVATLVAVLDLLRTTGLSAGWGIAYGWCPLVLKEFAGSGHLDSIATFFAVAALAVGARALVATNSRWRRYGAGVASALLALGVGAKLFPVVLAPVLAAGIAARCGLRVVLLSAAVFAGVSALTLAPMFWPIDRASPSASPDASAVPVVESVPPPGAPSGKTAGLGAFLKQWEMNDLLFMVLYENMRTQGGVAPAKSPWFDATPESWNLRLAESAPSAFALTRGVTLAVSLAIALGAAWRGAARLDGSRESIARWLRAAFLTLAWFWLLAPTQNPWYWCWAVPLLPWAGSRAWLAVSVLTLGYYLRFWFETHFPAPGVLETPYGGEYFFYFVVPWVEFTPLLAWLLWEVVRPPVSVSPVTDSAHPGPYDSGSVPTFPPNDSESTT